MGYRTVWFYCKLCASTLSDLTFLRPLWPETACTKMPMVAANGCKIWGISTQPKKGQSKGHGLNGHVSNVNIVSMYLKQNQSSVLILFVFWHFYKKIFVYKNQQHNHVRAYGDKWSNKNEWSVRA